MLNKILVNLGLIAAYQLVTDNPFSSMSVSYYVSVYLSFANTTICF